MNTMNTINNMTKDELIQKIQTLETKFLHIKTHLSLDKRYYSSASIERFYSHKTTKDILLDIEELLDEDYIPLLAESVERWDWEADCEGFCDDCYDGINDIEAIVELLPKKNQEKYAQKVKTLWTLYDDMVEEAERCQEEEDEEEDDEE